MDAPEKNHDPYLKRKKMHTYIPGYKDAYLDGIISLGFFGLNLTHQFEEKRKFCDLSNKF